MCHVFNFYLFNSLWWFFWVTRKQTHVGKCCLYYSSLSWIGGCVRYVLVCEGEVEPNVHSPHLWFYYGGRFWLIFFWSDCLENSSSTSKCVCLKPQFRDVQNSDKKCGNSISKYHFEGVKINLCGKHAQK